MIFGKGKGVAIFMLRGNMFSAEQDASVTPSSSAKFNFLAFILCVLMGESCIRHRHAARAHYEQH